MLWYMSNIPAYKATYCIKVQKNKNHDGSRVVDDNVRSTEH